MQLGYHCGVRVNSSVVIKMIVSLQQNRLKSWHKETMEFDSINESSCYDYNICI